MFESKTIGQTLAELEADHEKTATLPFPSIGLTLEIQATTPYRFLVKVIPEGEEPTGGILPINILGPMIMRMALADIAKAAEATESIADEAQEFLRTL